MFKDFKQKQLHVPLLHSLFPPHIHHHKSCFRVPSAVLASILHRDQGFVSMYIDVTKKHMHVTEICSFIMYSISRYMVLHSPVKEKPIELQVLHEFISQV